MALVDTKFMQRPQAFQNEDAHWQDLRLQLISFADFIGPQYSDLRFSVEKSAAAFEALPGQQSASRLLSAVLASITCGRDLRVMRSATGRGGFKAWRQLTSEFEPRVAHRRFGNLAWCVFS